MHQILLTFAAAIAAGGGPADGTSVTTLNSDKLKLYADVELVGRFDSGTAGDRTVEISTTAKTTNFLTSVTNANISAASLNAFTGATNITIGNTTGTTTVNHNVTILGNLTVQGDTTYVNTNVVTLEDPIISLGGSPNGGPARRFCC